MAEQKKPIRIRKARQTDAVAIFRLLETSFTDDELSVVAVDNDKLMVWVVTTIAAHEVWVADLSGRVVGSIALVPSQLPWSTDWLLSNCWCAVLPSFRRHGTGRMMIEAAIRSADESQAPLLIRAQSMDGPDWKDEFIGAFDGFSYIGGMFYRGAPDADH